MSAFVKLMSENTALIFDLILVAAFVIEGLFQLFSGKMFNYAGFTNRYTQESIDRFVRPSGAAVILEGVGFFLFSFSIDGGPLPHIMCWVGGIVMVLSVAAYLIMIKTILVKK